MSDPHDTQPAHAETPRRGHHPGRRPAGDTAGGPAQRRPASRWTRRRAPRPSPGQPTPGPRGRTREGHADRHHDQAAAGRSEVRPARTTPPASRLAEIHERSIKELEDGLAPELVEELERISLPFPDGRHPVRRGAPDRPGPAGRLAGGSLPRHPDRHRGPACRPGARRRADAAAPAAAGNGDRPRRHHRRERRAGQRAAAPQPGADPSQPRRPADPDHGPGQYL